jgi:hypothetical protein
MMESKKFVLQMGGLKIISSIKQKTSLKLKNIIEIKRGVLFDKTLLTNSKINHNSYPYFEGDVLRYQLNYLAPHWLVFDDNLKERPKDFLWFAGERILLRRLVNRRFRLMSTIINETCITNKNLYSIIAKPKTYSLPFILGILNSRLLSYLYVNQITQATKDDFPQVTIKDILELPFPSMAREISGKLENQVSALVMSMLNEYKQLLTAKTEQEKTVLSRQIEAIDRQIDRLVYDLYGLTEEEIRIVES